MKPAALISSRWQPTQCEVFLWREGGVVVWRKEEESWSVSTFLIHGTLSDRVNSRIYVANQIHETHARHIMATNSMCFLVKGRHGGWLKEKRRIRKCFYFSFNGTQLSTILRVIVVVHLAPFPRRSAREQCHWTLAARDLAERHR